MSNYPLFSFELISPDKVLISEQMEMVILPGIQGDFGVLADHAPLIAGLKSGIATLHRPKQSPEQFFVGEGFASLTASGCKVLVEQGISLKEIDAREVQSYIEGIQTSLMEEQREEEIETLKQNLRIEQAKLQLMKQIQGAGGYR